MNFRTFVPGLSQQHANAKDAGMHVWMLTGQIAADFTQPDLQWNGSSLDRSDAIQVPEARPLGSDRSLL